LSEFEQFDAIVIGAGQAGGPLSTALARAGKRTAIIEREHVGGTCINEGCTPTKTMVASARVAYLARRAADYGVVTGPVSVDMKQVRGRKRDMVDSFRGSSERRITGVEGVELVRGEARFTDFKTIDVGLNGGGTRRMRAESFFINTGGRPSLPELEGIGSAGALTSTTIMELDEAPEHLIVLGGGYVGLEFAQMFRRFGSRVTVINRGGRLLSREDADVSDALADILREDGVDILFNTEVAKIEREGGALRLALKGPGEDAPTLEGTHLLAAVGRTPNTDALNPAASGIELDGRGFIKVNERLETNMPGIYAMGDVNGGPQFTHISYDDFRILRTNLIQGGSASTRGRMVPYVVFTDPQLGRIGITEEEARKQGLNVRVASMPMSNIARAGEID
jgi:pyruvate/2-oxoglutarate dehydrogenase complex dihydrolipoamide dehydrogenase (E3) component